MCSLITRIILMIIIICALMMRRRVDDVLQLLVRNIGAVHSTESTEPLEVCQAELSTGGPASAFQKKEPPSGYHSKCLHTYHFNFEFAFASSEVERASAELPAGSASQFAVTPASSFACFARALKPIGRRSLIVPRTVVFAVDSTARTCFTISRPILLPEDLKVLQAQRGWPE